jgi:hypothetical protein
MGFFKKSSGASAVATWADGIVCDYFSLLGFLFMQLSEVVAGRSALFIMVHVDDNVMDGNELMVDYRSRPAGTVGNPICSSRQES